MATARINKIDSEQAKIQEQALENAINLKKKKRLADQKANNISKKQATSQESAPTASIPTTNRFSPLSSSEDEEDEILENMDFTENNKHDKQQKTVPIVINTSIKQQTTVKTTVEEIHAISNTATVKYAKESITIYTTDQTSYQAIRDYLTTRLIQHHTYTQKGNKEKKLVIKGFPTISPEQIAQSLLNQGIDTKKVSQMKTVKNKPKRPLPATPTYNEFNFPDLPRKNQHPPWSIQPPASSTNPPVSKKLITTNGNPNYINDLSELLRDFNAKHTTWHCKSNNTNGRTIYKYTINNPVAVLTPDRYTLYPSNSGIPSVVDFALTKSLHTNAPVETLNELESDHMPILLTLGDLNDPRHVQQMFSNYKKADWPLFRQTINDNLIINKSLKTQQDVCD
ncbi:Protein of unknown function [Cotesia congregata]|uniref:Endonuclease/exonuclease/phosphatase domain-containing protein n=1 Tax=Cotesia congregata TaxID=51543 RepID=A0A8J2MLG2_COTCN|nr:Protein of unknown function [Cotesia congregata]